MNSLLLTLLSLSVLITLYGVVKIFLFARDYNYRRSVFDNRVAGRKTERRSEDRRIYFRDETRSSL